MQIKNDNIINSAQIRNLITKHIEDNIDRLTELLTDLFVSLSGENAAGVDAGGTSTQTLDTFAKTMCHIFLSKHNDIFLIRMVSSAY